MTPSVLSQGAEVTIPCRNPEEVERLKAILSPDDFARIQLISANLKTLNPPLDIYFNQP